MEWHLWRFNFRWSKTHREKGASGNTGGSNNGGSNNNQSERIRTTQLNQAIP